MKEPHAGMDSYERLGKLSLAQLKELREQSAKRKKRMRAPALVPQERGTTVPLSYAQERLWFLDQLGLVGPAYNMPFALRLEGPLNVAALERSFAELVRRHESLRTRFQSIAGEPIQVIDPPGVFTLEVRDVSGLREQERALQVKRLSGEEAQHPFELSRGPLLRVRLLKLAEREHVLLLTMHHIISDGWSLEVLYRELGALYTAYSQGQSSPLPDLPIQYADFAIWQRQWLQGEVLQNHLQYWSERLDGALPQLQLPTDRPRSAVASFRGALLTFDLPAALCQSLGELARHEGATLFMVALAAFQLLLSRHSGQQDIVVGSGIAGRTQAETESLIGFFVNMLILRTDLAGNPSFRQLLQRIQQVTLGAYAHQDLPFEKLVKELRPERNLSHQPVFQVALALQNFPHEQLEMAGLTWTRVEIEEVTSLFDLTLHLCEMPHGLRGMLEYATDLFDRETIERLAGNFQMLLEGIVADPDCPIQQLPLLRDADREHVLHRFNETAAAYPGGRLVHELFEAQVERAPEAVAVICEEQQLTYGELNSRANQVAHAVLARGVRPDDRVGLYAERGLDLVVGLLGILKAGGAYVPLDVSYPADRLTYMLRDSAPVVVLTQERLKNALPPHTAHVIALDAEADETRNRPVTNPGGAKLGIRPQHLAYIIYTSGSTGTPKGVMVEHRNVVNLTEWHCATFDVRPGCRCSSVAAVGFDAAGWEIWPALCAGATLLLVPPELARDVEALLEWWAKQPLDVSFLPTPVAELAFSRNIRNGRLRTLLVGGDRLRYRPAAASFELINNYGPTESTVVATSGRIGTGNAVLDIGRPIANTRIYIVDPHGQPVPIGATGEIYIGGAGVARGYLNRPDLTSERFIPDPFSPEPEARLYKSGDLGRWRADGTIEFIGRNDEQVKIRGYRIELGEIEAQLLRHAQVKDAVVLAHEEQPGERRLVAYIVGNRSVPSDAAADGEPAKLRNQVVGEWEQLYEETYGTQNQTTGPSFIGWNSSYTGQPIPEAEMQEWLDAAVARIRALKPRKLLEIGCGLGLLLQHLAPQSEVYVGTDFSASAIGQLRQWMSGREDLRHVRLLQRAATELKDLESCSFDTIVLNSVVQYFPDIDYLSAVLQEALRLLSPGGQIFIGDVRHLGLLTMFHSAVQLSKVASTVSVAQLRRRIARAVAQEKELLIDPKFFRALPRHVPGINAVEVQVKRGRAANELTRYRYDVVLHAGEQIRSRPVCEPLEWQAVAGSAADLRAALAERGSAAVRVTSIPNGRLARDAAAQRLIETSEERLETGVLRRHLSELKLEEPDLENLWDWTEELGYDVQVSWGTEGPPGCIDIELLDRARVGAIRQVQMEPLEAVKPWSAYANDPLENGFRQQLIPQLREYLKARLPDFMIPSAWVVLKELPLTAHGKVDRRALPTPQSRPQNAGEYVAPRSELERTLADIWAQVLRVDQVGIHDNFFELGGHSLLATQVVARIGSSLSIELPMRLLFEFPTIEQLAAQVDGMRRKRLLQEVAAGGSDVKELLGKVASMSASTVRELLQQLRTEGQR